MAEITYHEVTGPVAVIETEDGTSRYLYKGARIPKGVTNLKHLTSVGLVSKVTLELVDVDPTSVVEVTPAVFDPSEHSVEDVLAYLEGKDDAERDRVLAAEQAGKARKGLVGESNPA